VHWGGHEFLRTGRIVIAFFLAEAAPAFAYRAT